MNPTHNITLEAAPFSGAAKRPINSAKTKSVWLVDDREDIRDIVSELINRDEVLNCERQFTSAEEMLAALAVEPAPEIIVTDVSMKGMTGVDSIAPAKKLAAATHIFVMTTFYDTALVARAEQAGASGFFVKSHDWDETISCIRNRSMGAAPKGLAVQVEALQPAGREAAVVAGREELEFYPKSSTPLFARMLGQLRAFISRNYLDSVPAAK